MEDHRPERHRPAGRAGHAHDRRRRPRAYARGEPRLIVERVTEATGEIVEALARLLPQLSSATPPTLEELRELVAGTHLLLARDGSGTVLGALSLVLYRTPTGLKGTIEDVVVDETARGQGIGEALTREAQRIGLAAGVRSIGLTSRPSREAANRLYRRLGFEQRETNVYVWRPL